MLGVDRIGHRGGEIVHTGLEVRQGRRPAQLAANLPADLAGEDLNASLGQRDLQSQIRARAGGRKLERVPARDQGNPVERDVARRVDRRADQIRKLAREPIALIQHRRGAPAPGLDPVDLYVELRDLLRQIVDLRHHRADSGGGLRRRLAQTRRGSLHELSEVGRRAQYSVSRRRIFRRSRQGAEGVE